VAGSPGAPGPHTRTPGALEPLLGAAGTPQPAAPAAGATGGGTTGATVCDRLYRRHLGWRGLEDGGLVGVLAGGGSWLNGWRPQEVISEDLSPVEFRGLELGPG
jgi:hypothetical protein